MRDRRAGPISVLACLVSVCSACVSMSGDRFLQFDGLHAAPIAAPSDADVEDGEVLKSDGCTFWPDGNWKGCCTEHDRKYRNGGSFKERWAADSNLMTCMSRESGSFLFGAIAWIGVRVGGVGFLPTPFRWGFGRPFLGSFKEP